MFIKAYAKINISLDILGKRKDGYHLVKMIMQSVDIFDEITVEERVEGIELSCNKSFIPIDERNIAYKAAKLFLKEYAIEKGVFININKNIPVAAGMAGGSTDAAAVLKAMRELFKVDVSDAELMRIGLMIGADVPFCIKGGTALCEGIGEKFTELKSFRNKILVVVKPNFGVSTKDVYSALKLDLIFKHVETEKIIEAMEKDNLHMVCYNMKNILENVTLPKFNVLKQIKNQLINFGACGAMMSGSGPTIFGFFDDICKAKIAFEEFKEKYNEVFLTKTI